ncbi:MAG: hypothetical protein WDZ80_05425 [Candidatus Paceibacterota bacterium]
MIYPNLSLEDIDYKEAISVFRFLIERGWKLMQEKGYPLEIESPEGEFFSLENALYFALTGKDIRDLSNIKIIFEKSNFNKNLLEKLKRIKEVKKEKEDFLLNFKTENQFI